VQAVKPVLRNGFKMYRFTDSHLFCAEVKDQHLKGIRAFKEESGFRHYIVVSRDRVPRRTSDGIDILPWSVFLSQLWAGELTA
jgi:hypothetical protein